MVMSLMTAMMVDMVVSVMLNDVVDIIVDWCRIWLNFLDRGGVTLIIYVSPSRLHASRFEWQYCA